MPCLVLWPAALLARRLTRVGRTHGCGRIDSNGWSPGHWTADRPGGTPGGCGPLVRVGRAAHGPRRGREPCREGDLAAAGRDRRSRSLRRRGPFGRRTAAAAAAAFLAGPA